MLLARGGDGSILALRQRVVFAHQALQLREFADHFGQQIRLRQMRGAFCLFDIGADQRRDLGRQPLDALDALALRAQLFVKHDLLEFRQPIFELGLQVGLVEKLRVAQPRADHALVAGDDGLAAVARFDIGGEDEFVGELSGFGIADDKAFLVVADGGADHFARDRQEFLVERSHQHDRPFDQARDLVEQHLVLDQLKALRERQLLGVGENDVLARLRIEHDLRRLQFAS